MSLNGGRRDDSGRKPLTIPENLGRDSEADRPADPYWTRTPPAATPSRALTGAQPIRPLPAVT
jgi:hypothetical protein